MLCRTPLEIIEKRRAGVTLNLSTTPFLIQQRGAAPRLAMPMYSLGELVYAFIFPKFRRMYREYRFNRGDNTLLMFALKKLGAGVHSSYTRIYNRFGYHEQALTVEDAATGKLSEQHTYFVSTKKIYSNRFRTDAYNDIFAKQLKTVGVGLDAIKEYQTEKATEAELKSQNSYFINEIVKHNQDE